MPTAKTGCGTQGYYYLFFMTIELQTQERELAISSIERYCRSELDIAIGNMQATALLNYFLQEIAPAVYNRAIADAQSKLQTRVLELDMELYESGFTYWNKVGKTRK